MLLLQSRIRDLPIASIQASHRIGVVSGFVLQPNGLVIAALQVDSPISPATLYLHTEDIRETRLKGILIDHNEQLMEATDLVRLSELLQIDFKLLDKRVVSESGKKLGFVADYTINTSGWIVQKIHVTPPLVKMLSKPDLIIDRRQIIRVTDSEIVVDDAHIKSKRSAFSIPKQLRVQDLKASPAKHE